MLKKLSARLTVTSTRLIVLIAIFWMAFANLTFFSALLNDYPPTIKNALFLTTAVFSFTSVIIIVLSLFCFRRTIKPLLIALLLVSSLAAYFMDTYNIIIDDLMIRNTFETDTKEAGDLLSLAMVAYLILLGILPAIAVYKAKIVYKSFYQETLARLKLIGILLAITLTLLYFQSAATASFFREHKQIRFHSNPANYLFGLGRYVHHTWRSMQSSIPLILTGKDARIPATDIDRELIIVVVGETARADRFSLNGYARKTNPLLEKQNVVSFTNVRSCATLTAISVPCMFSIDPEKGFNVEKAKGKENALDVLKRSGAQVLWRDNNSSSKNVADRVTYQDFRTPKTNTICEGEECRDEGMLVGLQDYINAQPKGDIVIVLHSMGNHGPAYYKRYPKEFRKFTPECQTNELSDCSHEEINNAYDNAILYTDYFLNKTIELLKQNDDKFETSMLYVSDHGESLGENNVYLHGMPNFLAPKEQRHVPLIMWAGKHLTKVKVDDLKARKDKPYSHDNIFHTLLGLMEVESTAYNKDLDMTKN